MTAARPPREFLRLDVQAAATGLQNLIQNPDGNLGGWGWITPVGNSTMAGDPVGGLKFTNPTPATPAWFTSEPLPVTAGQYVKAAWELSTYTSVSDLWYRVRFEFLDSAKALLSSSAQTAYSKTLARAETATYQAPASTAYVRLRVDVYSTNAGANPTAGQQSLWREFVVASAATSGALGSTFTNLAPNPRFGAIGSPTSANWTAGPGCGLSSYSSGGVNRMTITRAATTFGELLAWTNAMAVTAGVSYRARLVAGVFGIPKAIKLEWRNAASAVIQTDTVGGTNNPIVDTTATAPAGATSVRLGAAMGSVNQGGNADVSSLWFGTAADAANGPQAPSPGWNGATPDGGGWDYSWAGTPELSASTAIPVGVGLAYVEPVSYVDVLDSNLGVTVNRYPLDVGTMAANVTDANLDPAATSAIRPGRRVRLMALTPGDVWEEVYVGRLDSASTTYRDKPTQSGHDVNVALVALDVNAALANVQVSAGVASIPELPYLLEGAGVPWNVNGSGNQVGAAVVVAQNDQASLLDQVALTRDTDLGYAWTSRRGVLYARDDRAAAYYGGEPYALDEGDYSDLKVGFDTAAIVNTVTVVRLEVSGDETNAVTYGPYTDSASVKEWGPRAATYTIQGSVSPATYAADVLAANAQPTMRVASLRVPIRDQADVTPGKALLDLYAKVRVTNAKRGLDQTLRVTSVQHSITSRRWYLDLEFGSLSGVAAPTQTPSTNSNADLGPARITLVGGGSQVIPSGVVRGVAFTVMEQVGVWNPVANAYSTTGHTLTVPETGKYLVTLHAMWDAHATVGTRRDLEVVINKGSGFATAMRQEFGASTGNCSNAYAFEIDLTAGWVLAIGAFQNTGANLNIRGDLVNSRCTVRRVL